MPGESSMWVVSPGGGQGTTAAVKISPFPLAVSTIPACQIVAEDNGSWAATVNLQSLANGSGGVSPRGLQVRQIWNTDGSVAFPTMQNLPSTGTADLTINASGAVAPQTSSARFKENIEPLAADFERILALEPKAFCDVGTGDRGIGYVAEDVAALRLTDLVSVDGSGQPLSVHYKLIPIYLLELLKAQQRTIEMLRDDVRELNRRLPQPA